MPSYAVEYLCVYNVMFHMKNSLWLNALALTYYHYELLRHSNSSCLGLNIFIKFCQRAKGSITGSFLVSMMWKLYKRPVAGGLQVK